ncbi:MAG: hypothetical protein AAGE96_25155 [Cyanobacteria bacterium P01_G01_bin.19]
MQPSTVSHQSQRLTSPQLPLAVYREVAAHLGQVIGVKATIIMRPIEHQPGAKFDYYQSQVAALQIDYAAENTPQDRERVAEILAYYAQRYRPWEDAPKADS